MNTSRFVSALADPVASHFTRISIDVEGLVAGEEIELRCASFQENYDGHVLGAKGG